MDVFTLAHIAAGSVALLSGFTALAVRKGARTHRLAGKFFVPSMLFMGLSGAAIAYSDGVRISVLAGLMVSYLVWTAYVVARECKGDLHRHFVLNACIGGFIGALGAYYLYQAWLLRSMSLDGYPVGMVALFTLITLCGCLQDIVWALRPKHATIKLVRYHLWRMGFSLWNASSAFFLGQADEFPKALQKMWLLSPPVLLVLVLSAYFFVQQSLNIRRKASVVRQNG